MPKQVHQINLTYGSAKSKKAERPEELSPFAQWQLLNEAFQNHDAGGKLPDFAKRLLAERLGLFFAGWKLNQHSCLELLKKIVALDQKGREKVEEFVRDLGSSGDVARGRRKK